MGKIRTTGERDVYGTGNTQEVTFDNGKSYTIRTTCERDVYGTGYTKEIVENSGSGIYNWWTALIMFLMPIIIGGFFIGSAFLFFKMIGY